MRQTKRKILMAAIVSLAGVAGAIPIIVSGTASAQENARLCGRIYKTTDPTTKFQSQVIRLYEVYKNDWGSTCPTANITANRTVSSSPFELVNQSWDGDGSTIWMEVCEEFKTKYLGGRSLNFVEDFDGADFPKFHDQDDICQNMKRSGHVSAMRAYWLYDDDGQGDWEFRAHHGPEADIGESPGFF